MNNFLFIVVSKDETFKMNVGEFAFDNATVEYILNNRDPLPNVYNRYLQQARVTDSFDYIIFMHADVSLDIKSLCNHIQECSEKYDVMGLCGTSIMNVSQKPLNWWTGSNPTPQAKWGCVTHGELGNQMSFFNGNHHPNENDHEVACIDGLCIVFGPKAIHSDLLFDEQFDFHCYDTDLSFLCVMQKNLKLGVIVEKSLLHYSVGKGILEPSFLEREAKLRAKWNI